MGCGKSTLGVSLSKTLHLPHVDTDTLIEKKTNSSISDLFSTYGEDYFRSLEKEAIVSIDSKKGAIISTGGGIVTRPDTCDLLKEKGFVLYLYLELEALIERLKNDTHRPLLQTPNPIQVIKKLYASREALYKSTAHIVINTTQKSIPQLRDEIIKTLSILKTT